ncbi:hypothetical protein [Streptomyces malaysiensis]|uniref:Uncharacterized protein n=1 Tax=Streptomyces malaysiensis subsp. samsunensis TaxID=459658 RepID=A0A9X2LXI6_STRMQ|nr:hypothetical protein [Streptomyces samsunensis]MCQ8831796.1 hypothetical protein [Streptomyces samsunensis]
MRSGREVARIITASASVNLKNASPEQVAQAVRQCADQFTTAELQAGKVELEKRLGLR